MVKETILLIGFIVATCGWLLIVHALFIPNSPPRPKVFNFRKPILKKTFLAGAILSVLGVVISILGAI